MKNIRQKKKKFVFWQNEKRAAESAESVRVDETARATTTTITIGVAVTRMIGAPTSRRGEILIARIYHKTVGRNRVKTNNSNSFDRRDFYNYVLFIFLPRYNTS